MVYGLGRAGLSWVRDTGPPLSSFSLSPHTSLLSRKVERRRRRRRRRKMGEERAGREETPQKENGRKVCPLRFSWSGPRKSLPIP